MRTTIPIIGLLAGLAGSAVLAQAVTAPDAEATQPAEPTTGASPAPLDNIPNLTGVHGPQRDEGGFGGGVPGLAPLESYDTDGDGMITQEEIEARRTERFAAADTNSDGALSAEELIAMEEAIREDLRQAQATAHATATITRMDDNGDGLLQAEELAARTPQLAPIFDELDTDNDGSISQVELEAGRPSRGRDEDHAGQGNGHGPRDEQGGFMGGRLGN